MTRPDRRHAGAAASWACIRKGFVIRAGTTARQDKSRHIKLVSKLRGLKNGSGGGIYYGRR